MKEQRRPLEGDSAEADNERVKRYVAKYSINPAITHGFSHLVGSLEVGEGKGREGGREGGREILHDALPNGWLQRFCWLLLPLPPPLTTSLLPHAHLAVRLASWRTLSSGARPSLGPSRRW